MEHPETDVKTPGPTPGPSRLKHEISIVSQLIRLNYLSTVAPNPSIFTC